MPETVSTLTDIPSDYAWLAYCFCKAASHNFCL